MNREKKSGKDPYAIIGDFHTHTIASQHAYSTIKELVEASIEQGFSSLCITDHGPEMLDGAIRHHFLCMSGLPSSIKGLHLYKGAEVNIKDFAGRMDLDEEILKNLDFIIASYHIEAIESGSKEENTRGWLAAISNPYVDCLGHTGNPVYPFDHETVVKELQKYGKTLEINSNSFAVRKGSEPNCRDLALLCKKYKVPVLVNSDAHHLWRIGDVEESIALLKSISFPPELILNASQERIESFITRRKKEKGILS